MFLLKKKINKKKIKKNDSIQNPKILEVNLVRDAITVSFDWRHSLLILSLILVMASLLISEVYFGLDYWQKQEEQKTNKISRQIDQTKAETSKLKNSIRKALNYQNKSLVFSKMIEHHVYWTNFFNWLEKNTLSSVKYQAFSGKLDGNYNLKATAQTYADVSWQVKSFLNDPLTEKVKVDKASQDNKEKGKDSRVEFKLSLKVKPEIFKK